MKHPDWAQGRTALADSVVLGLACVVTYLLATKLLSWVHSVAPADDLLGGMWAVIAAIFVNRSTYSESRGAAVSRLAASFVSFVYCLIYLTFLPFHTWGLALLVGVSALTARLIGRPGDAITAAITTTVVLVVAEVSPQGAWEQPILRLADTAIGVAVGLASAWLDQRLIRPRIRLTPTKSCGDTSGYPPRWSPSPTRLPDTRGVHVPASSLTTGASTLMLSSRTVK
jgi:hypothetical protein